MFDKINSKLKGMYSSEQYSKIESACLAVSHDDNAVDKRLDCIKECKKGFFARLFPGSKLDDNKLDQVLEAFDKPPYCLTKDVKDLTKDEKLLNKAYYAGKVGHTEQLQAAMGEAQKPVSIGHYHVIPHQAQQQASSGVVYEQLPNMGGALPPVQYGQLPDRGALQYGQLPPEPEPTTKPTGQSVQYETLPPTRSDGQYGSVSQAQPHMQPLPDFSSGVSPDNTPSGAKPGSKAPSRF